VALTKTIEAGRASGVVKDESLSRGLHRHYGYGKKNIAYLTDARSTRRPAKLVALAQGGRDHAAPDICGAKQPCL